MNIDGKKKHISLLKKRLHPDFNHIFKDNERKRDGENKSTDSKEESSIRELSNNVANSATTARTKKRKRKKADDANNSRPKHPMNAYNFFFQEERKKLLSGSSLPTEAERAFLEEGMSKGAFVKKNKDKLSFEEIGKIIGKRWKQVPDGAFQYFTKLAADDLARYRKELKQYKEKQKVLQEKSEAEQAAIAMPEASLEFNPTELSINTGNYLVGSQTQALIPGRSTLIATPQLSHQYLFSGSTHQLLPSTSVLGPAQILTSLSNVPPSSIFLDQQRLIGQQQIMPIATINQSILTNTTPMASAPPPSSFLPSSFPPSSFPVTSQYSRSYLKRNLTNNDSEKDT